MNIRKNKLKISYLLIAAILIFTVALCTVGVYAQTASQVYLGGMPFGIRFGVGEVTVVKTNSFISGGSKVAPAEDAGIVANDIIHSVNGESVKTIYDVVSAVKEAEDEQIYLTIKRGARQLSINVCARVNDDTGEKQLGVMLKDSSAGIGTVTFIKDDLHTFAGLGHGICDSTGGNVLKINSGYISNVRISGINKGKSGAPGELKGILESDKCGKLLANSEVGVYGVRTDSFEPYGGMIDVAEADEVSTGKAKILCTLDDNVRREYEIEIKEMNMGSTSKSKNFIICVTDNRLLEKTGGIVQGMSGSPIVQNGKLIGAVTHVMINDPTTGYGIYIKNMMNNNT